MKERKCRKCKLTYKGLKEYCPFCHKITKIGIINKIMCVLGYIFFAIILILLAHYIYIKTAINAIILAPIIITIITIVIIAGILFLIFK